VEAFEHLGLGELAATAQQLSKAGRWEELPPLIDDHTLHQFVTIGTWDEIGEKLLGRYGDVVTDIEFSIAVRDDEDRKVLQKLAAQIRDASEVAARDTIVGRS
jgi:hypothetical protein